MWFLAPPKHCTRLPLAQPVAKVICLLQYVKSGQIRLLASTGRKITVHADATGFGYRPELSEGSIKPPIFQTFHLEVQKATARLTLGAAEFSASIIMWIWPATRS